jgi:imidazolonepropionase-like amidohydrolase
MSRVLFRITMLFLALPALSVFADETPSYLRAGQLIDVLNGRTLTDQVIVIQNDRIVNVANTANVTIPDGATVIDLSDKTVMPGLIDMHVHLTSDHRFHGYQGLGISVPRSALYGVLNPTKTMNAGFTTVLNVGAKGYADVALRDAINDGEIVGPRMRVSGPSLGITGGHCDNNLLPSQFGARNEGVEMVRGKCVPRSAR